MTKQEFEEQITPTVNNGVGGAVSNEAWADIELVYMNIACDKKYVADLFWNHPGKFSKTVKIVKEFIELRDAKVKATRARAEAVAAYCQANEALSTFESIHLKDEGILFY